MYMYLFTRTRRNVFPQSCSCCDDDNISLPVLFFFCFCFFFLCFFFSFCCCFLFLFHFRGLSAHFCLFCFHYFTYILTVSKLGRNFSRRRSDFFYIYFFFQQAGFDISETFFLFFPQKIDFDMSCKLSSGEAVCMKCQSLFSGENKKLYHEYCRQLKFVPKSGKG